MARSVETIREWLENRFMVLFRTLYGIAQGVSFTEYFSKASLENLLVYWLALFGRETELYIDDHEQQVEDYISQMKPHSLRWYQQLILRYQHGLGELDEEFGTYINPEGTTDEEIAASKVVRYASVMEDNATLYIKVAGENSSGQKVPLSTAELSGLSRYVSVVKDAGVRVSFTNAVADRLRIDLTVYYDPQVLSQDGTLLSDQSVSPVEDAVKSYIQNLPFNGVFRQDVLFDALQSAAGVCIPVIDSISTSEGNSSTFTDMVEPYAQPYAGYYVLQGMECQYIPYTL